MYNICIISYTAGIRYCIANKCMRLAIWYQLLLSCLVFFKQNVLLKMVHVLKIFLTLFTMNVRAKIQFVRCHIVTYFTVKRFFPVFYCSVSAKTHFQNIFCSCFKSTIVLRKFVIAKKKSLVFSQVFLVCPYLLKFVSLSCQWSVPTIWFFSHQILPY